MKITIKNQDIELKNTMRAYLIYEQLSNKTFNPQTITDMLIYFYSLILANNKTIQLTFAEFIDILDDNPEYMSNFNQWVTEQTNMDEQFSDVKKKRGNQ